MLDGHDVVKSVAATKKYIRNHINHDSNNHNNNNYVRTYIIKIDKKTATSTSTTTTYLQTNCDKQRYIRVKYSMYRVEAKVIRVKSTISTNEGKP